MFTLIICSAMAGFYFIYCASAQVESYPLLAVEKNIGRLPLVARILGVIFFVVSIVSAILFLGLGAGILFFSVTLMTMGSLVVMLSPIRALNYKTILMLSIFTFIIETFLF